MAELVATYEVTDPSRHGTSEASALIQADVLGQARTLARAPARYVVLMAAGGVIAALAVLKTARP